MTYNRFTGITNRISTLTIAVVFTLTSVISVAVPVVLSNQANALSSDTVAPYLPGSTNDENRNKNWAHVNELSKQHGSVTLQFVNSRNFVSCFEYRTDGDASEKIADAHHLPKITDGLFPSICLTNDLSEMTILANSFVEVRSVFGAESDEHFDWTRFDVGRDTSAPASSNLRVEQIINGNTGKRLKIYIDLTDESGVNTSTKYTYVRINHNGKEYSFGFTKVAGSANTYVASIDTTRIVPVNQFDTIGSVSIRVADIHKNGRSSKPDFLQKLGFDNSGPGASLVTPTSGSVIQGTTSLRFKVSDHTGVSGGYAKLVGANGKEASSTLVHSNDDQWLATFQTSNLPDGQYRVDIRPTDSFGTARYGINKGTVVVDNTAPVANITSHDDGDSVEGIVDIVGTVTDENPMNTYFRVTGPNNYGKTSQLRDGRYVHDLTWDTSTLPNGEYTVRFETRDSAGNKTNDSVEVIKLNVNNPQPVVNGANFNTHDGSDYRGINVGFNINNFTEVSSVTVDLHTADGPFISNSHNQNLLDLINNDDTTQLSTPFIIQDGTYTELYWTLGGFKWVSDSLLPTHAVVTVTGLNNSGEEVTVSTILTNLTESNGWTFESLLPVARVLLPPPADVEPNQNSTNQGTNGAAIITNNFAAARTNLNRIAALGNNQTPGTNESTETGEVESAAITSTDEADEVEKELVESTEASATWYWTIALVALLGAVFFGYRNFKSYNKNN